MAAELSIKETTTKCLVTGPGRGRESVSYLEVYLSQKWETSVAWEDAKYFIDFVWLGRIWNWKELMGNKLHAGDFGKS